MCNMQDAENEGEGSVLMYVTEPEFLKQHSSSRVMTHCHLHNIFEEQLGDNLENVILTNRFVLVYVSDRISK